MSPEEYPRLLWSGVLAQYLVIRKRDQARLGLVSLTNADFEAQHAELSVGRFSTHPSRDFLHASRMFVDHAFSVWPFAKLYLHVAEYNAHQIASGLGTLFEVEGRLKDFLAGGDEHYDLLIMSMSRAAWARYRERSHPRPGGRNTAAL